MNFKHPEILWALSFLIIPIIVHLFQLRKFQKEAFTNVKFLKQISIQTRKSSQLKKWLTLLTRMLALGTLIIAFAQPYYANRNVLTNNMETVVYLDNSFSMQAKGDKGELLKRAINEFIENIPHDEEITLFTNTKTYPKTSINSIKEELLTLGYSSNQIYVEDVLLKGKSFFSKNDGTLKNFVVISDFQQQKDSPILEKDSLLNLYLVKLKPVNTNNIAIDSLYITERNPSNIHLSVGLKMQGESMANLPVSLYNGDKLIAKTSVGFENNTNAYAYFTLPTNENINGRVSIEDNGLLFDNELFFNINQKEKINVLSINEADDAFLKRIYSEDEFNYSAYPLNQLAYKDIPDQNLILLNELQEIPASLQTTLKSFKTEGGSILTIPSINIDQTSYSQFIKMIGLPEIISEGNQEKKITAINYDHPLFNEVFDKQVSNFQYPKVNSFYTVQGNASNILQFEDGKPFLLENHNNYLFTAPLSNENSNFKNSPLIVPTLYNIAKNSLKLPQPYFILGRQNNFDVKVGLGQDEIVSIGNLESEFIPMQQSRNNLVNITTDESPVKAGIFSIKSKNDILGYVSYNYDRQESLLQYMDTSNFNTVNISSSVAQIFDKIKSESNVNELWKWFVIFALVFLTIEMLILKYFK